MPTKLILDKFSRELLEGKDELKRGLFEGSRSTQESCSATSESIPSVSCWVIVLPANSCQQLLSFLLQDCLHGQALPQIIASTALSLSLYFGVVWYTGHTMNQSLAAGTDMEQMQPCQQSACNVLSIT